MSAGLKPVQNTEDARELGAKGGRKSGEARRKKKELRERLEILLARKTGRMETADAISLALIEKALAGDVRAFEVIRDTLGEKPASRIEMPQGLIVRWHDTDSDDSL